MRPKLFNILLNTQHDDIRVANHVFHALEPGTILRLCMSLKFQTNTFFSVQLVLYLVICHRFGSMGLVIQFIGDGVVGHVMKLGSTSNA